MKKIFTLLASVVMLLPLMRPADTKALNFSMKTTTESESAILVHMNTGTVLHEKNPDTKQMPGQLVNLMAAVVAIENSTDLSEEITITEEIYSDLYETEYPDDLRFSDVVEGDVLSVGDLIASMMLTSSVEASQTLAYRFGNGNIDNFVDMMNDKAAELGLVNTHFTNATGLYDEKQYSSARDMANLTLYAMKIPHFEELACAAEYNPTVPNLEHHENHASWIWHNSNEMTNPESSYYYPGVKGVKTGSLDIVGRNLISIASQDGESYLVVLMRAPFNDADGNLMYYNFTDATNIFNWAFKHFSYQVVLSSTAELGEIPVELADGKEYVLARPKNEFSILWSDEVDISTINRKNITWYYETLNAPVKRGDVLGEVTLKYSGEDLGTVELVAVSDVERSFFKYNAYAITQFPKSKWMKKAFTAAFLLSFLYILICVYSYAVFKNKKKETKPKYAVPNPDKATRKK